MDLLTLVEAVSSRNPISVRFEVYIQPRASKNELVGMHGSALKIRITAPPVENAANRALLEFVAEQLGVAKSRVRIVAGTTGRRKMLEVDGVTADGIAEKLGLKSAPR